MKKIIFFMLAILLGIMFFVSCTINFPYDFEMTGKQYRVIFRVVPEDSLLLLNGKLLGEVYEFSTKESALVLSSRGNELVIKHQGYIEELVDLNEYSERDIVINMNLKKDKRYIEKKEFVKKTPKDNEIRGIRAKPKYIKESDIASEQQKPRVFKGNLTLNISPSDSAIYINNAFWGVSPKLGIIKNISIKNGKFIIDVTKPGYKRYTKKLTISDKNNNIKLKINLKKE